MTSDYLYCLHFASATDLRLRRSRRLTRLLEPVSWWLCHWEAGSEGGSNAECIARPDRASSRTTLVSSPLLHTDVLDQVSLRQCAATMQNDRNATAAFLTLTTGTRDDEGSIVKLQ